MMMIMVENNCFLIRLDFSFCDVGTVYTGSADGKIWAFKKDNLRLVTRTGIEHPDCGEIFGYSLSLLLHIPSSPVHFVSVCCPFWY